MINKEGTDLEMNLKKEADSQYKPEATIQDMMVEELKLKVKVVVAYLFFVVSRATIYAVGQYDVVEYYEYVFCAGLMTTILLVYKAVSHTGLTDKKVVFLNMFIPMCIMTSAIWHMANLKPMHFNSQEAWSFC